jgi:hypothetical protein
MALRDLQERTGQLCPREPLHPENQLPGELALAATRIGADHPLWVRLFEMHTEGFSKEARLALFYRVLNSAGHPDVAARVKRQREQEKKK